MGKPVVHWEITGKDGKKLQNFYSKIFDWTIHPAPMDYSLVHAEERGIGGGIGADPEGSGHVTFYVEVGDLAATLKQIESLGGKTLMPPTEIPGQVTFALFADPEGHMVGLIKGEQQ